MKKFKKKYNNDDQNDFEDSLNNYITEIKKEIKRVQSFKSDPDLYFKTFIIEVIKEWIEFYNFILNKCYRGNKKIDIDLIVFTVSNINNLKLILFLINDLQFGD